MPPHPAQPRGGRPWLLARPALCGVLFVLRTGIQSRWLPAELGCGSGVTCWRRRAWERVEVWHRLRRLRLARLEEAHTRHAATTGRTFEQAEPNYRAGFTSAYDERYAGQDFETAEPELRRTYEADTTRGRVGDSWEQLRREVREGWNRACGR